MYWRTCSAAAAVLVCGFLSPSWAGTEEDPEVRGDSCGATVDVGGEHVVCAAWFDSSTEPAGGRTLTTSMRINGDAEARKVPARFSLSWTRGRCQEGWTLTDVLAGGPRLELGRSFPGGGTTRVVLDAGAAEYDGSLLRVRLAEAAFARVGSGLAPGSRLSEPRAASSIVVEPPLDDVAEVATFQSETAPGREYVVPHEQ